MIHEYDCEVYTLADVLKDMLRYEETIDDYDTRKHFSILVNDLIDAVADVNRHIGDARDELYAYDTRCEDLEDRLYSANETIDDLRERILTIKEAVEC